MPPRRRSTPSLSRLCDTGGPFFLHLCRACSTWVNPAQRAGSFKSLTRIRRRLSRDLLLRGITYKLQERPLGGLSKSIIRKLERRNLDSEASDAQKPAPPISLKPGTRLVREWRGVTCTVLVDADGFEWNGRRYRSLTIVAREITGAHWSGPRFFGLRKRAGRTIESAEGEDADA